MELSERYYSCFFTGHRIIGNEGLRRTVYEALKKRIVFLYNEKGVDRFICGGAIGFDTMAAEAVLEVKKTLPYIKLVIYVPCHNHYIKWNNAQIDQWRNILRSADDAVYITSGLYNEECMKKRNRAMADSAHYCIAYCIRRGSGTGSTLAYAETKNCEIYNLIEYL